MASKPDDLPMLALIETPNIPTPTVDDQARVVLLDGEAFDAFYERMKAETDKHVPDVTTDKGRKAVIALARRVTTTKTAITAAAKGLTEGWRQQTATVNAARKPIEEKLAELAAEVRRPVTEWEAAEAARVERNRALVDDMRQAATVTLDDTAASVEERGRRIHGIAFGEGWSAEEEAEAVAVKAATVQALVAARNRLRQEEADKAELARLRQEAEERAVREAEAQAAQEAEEAARRAEEERLAAIERENERQRQAEAAEAERIAKAERDAEQRVRDEADRVAREAESKRAYARQIIDYIKQVGLGMIGGQTYPYGILIRELTDKIAIDDSLGDMQDEVRTIRDVTLANVQAAMERQAEKAREAEANEQRERAAREDAKRAANRAHVAKVMGAAKEAIMTCGVTEDQARSIVTAIKAGLVPAVGITF